MRIAVPSDIHENLAALQAFVTDFQHHDEDAVLPASGL